MRTIQSPGVEISEVDLSLRPSLPVGTNILIPGFSSKGPTEEVIEITTLSEFENVYGMPSNAAERYFYHTFKAAKQSPGNTFVYRLPYGGEDDLGDVSDKYSALVYPIVALSGQRHDDGDPHANFYKENSFTTSKPGGEASTALSAVSSNPGRIPWSDGVAYYIGEPQNYYITAQEYDGFKQGTYEWSTSSFAATGSSDKSPFGTTFKTAVEGGAGMVIINSRKNIINEKMEGFYVGVIDNTNLNPATDYDGCEGIETVTRKLSGSNPSGTSVDKYLSIPGSRLNFDMTGQATPVAGANGSGKSTGGTSVSEVLENLSDIELGTQEFDDTICIGLFKVRESVLAADTSKLDFILAESYVGSLNGFKRVNSPLGGTAQSHFIEDVASAKVGTPNIEIFVNPHISNEQGDWFDSTHSVSKKKVRVHTSKSHTDELIYINETELSATSAFRASLDTDSAGDDTGIDAANSLYPAGVFKDTSVRTIKVGAIPTKLERMFEVVDNYELYPLDLVLEAGLGTVYVGTQGGTTNGFDDEKPWDMDGTGVGKDNMYLTKINENLQTSGTVLNYRFVNDAFINFCQNKRKDILYISDNLRYVFVNGKNSKTLNQEFTEYDITKGIDVTTKKYFSKHIYWPLRHLQGNANSSYACAFGNWVKTFDGTLNRGIWAPFSGFAASLMANTDANFQPWYAPAGFTRGVLSNVSDIAVYPKLKERDQLYKINQNPVANFPNDGFVVFGQKTLQRKPSAFDRINVRRLFLYLEKATRATVKYFVFEPNTLFTRTQVVNVLTPIFENAKNTDGMYDYLIVCDERNNTPDVIDQNEMVIDIYIKPVRAAEFILVNFYATRTGQDFNELVG